MPTEKPSKIAVVRYRYIGDTLLTIPFLRELRQQQPQAEIHLLVGHDAADLMKGCPDVDQVIPFEPKRLGFWQAVQRIRGEGYDRAYLLKRSLSSALMVWLAGVPQRIGFDTEHRGFLLTQRVPYRSHEQHEALCFLDHLSPQGAAQADVSLKLTSWIPETASQKALTWVTEAGHPRVVLHATSTNRAKCWPIEHFVGLAKRLLTECGATLFFLGTAPEAEVYQPLITAFSSRFPGRLVNLCGETSLVESMALLKTMDLVVANDSGMVHMAAAADVPVVSIFGPMDPLQWRPLSDKSTVLIHPSLTCRPCRMKITCQDLFPCLSEITPESVFNACKPYLTSWSGPG